MATKFKLPGEVMGKILHDINLNISPATSKLEYTSEMLAYRKEAEREWEEHLEKNPDAEMYVPEDLPSNDIPFDED
jgi:hypothetical protein